MKTYPVLVGQTCFLRLEYLGDEDLFGPFAVISKDDGEPSATGLTRCDAIDWMARHVGWGHLDATIQVDEAIRWYNEMSDRLALSIQDARGSVEAFDVTGQ